MSLPLNKIYNMPCENGLKLLDNESVDLTVTSPPYDNLRDYKGYKFDFEAIAKELLRVTKKGGVVVWVVGDATINGSETGTSFKQALYFKEIGFNLHDTMIFHKQTPPLTHSRYEQHFEYMFIFINGKIKTFNPIFEKKIWKDNRIKKHFRREKNNSIDFGYSGKSEYKIKGNVWKYNTGGGHTTKDKIAYNHPAIFPEQLVADHIYSWSNKNDIILDPFIGSGTTAKMAMKLKRNFIGFEISKEYCDIAEERIKKNIDLFALI